MFGFWNCFFFLMVLMLCFVDFPLVSIFAVWPVFYYYFLLWKIEHLFSSIFIMLSNNLKSTFKIFS